MRHPTLGAPLDWNDLSDEPLAVLDIEELPGGDDALVDSVEEEASDDETADFEESSDGESMEPTEDSLQKLTSDESEEVSDALPGVEDEEN